MNLSTDLTGCPHESIVRSDGEAVCTKCGAVVDGPNADGAGTGGPSSPMPGLFPPRSLGSREVMPEMDGTADARRYFRGGMFDEMTLWRLSSVCDQLELPQHVQDDAWKRFLRTSGQVPPRKAEHACMAIFYACMDGETAVTDGEIIDAVKTHFGRKRIPSMSKILHRFAHMLGDGGAKDHDKYMFNTMLRRLTVDPGMQWDRLDRRKRFAWLLFTDVYRDGGPKGRARNAIEHAFELGKWGPRG